MATPQIHTLSLHDALPICSRASRGGSGSRGCDGSSNRRPCTPSRDARRRRSGRSSSRRRTAGRGAPRSEEHTSELQSLTNLVCRLLLEKKKKKKKNANHTT